MGRKKKELNQNLTEAELKIMNIIWPLGEASVYQVQEKLLSQSNYAYNTVSTLMRLLESKKFLGSFKQGKTHIYYPLILKDQYGTDQIKHVINDLFDGTALNLVQRLVSTVNLAPEEINEIKKMLDQVKDEKNAN